MATFSFKSLALLALPLALATHLQAQTVTDPVGVVKIEIAAAASPTQPTYSFLSTSMSQEVAYQGVVNFGSTGTITIGSDDWTVNQFSSVPHYAIVASGSREGDILDIASNTVNTLTLSGGPATEDQNGLAGETIRIHKHNTIASIFGTNHQPNSGTVQAGGVDTADQVLIYDAETNQYRTYFFNNESNPAPFGNEYHQGWIQTSNLEEDVSNTIIYPETGFIFKRIATTAFTISVSGQVITNKIRVPVISGYNLVAIPYPVDKSLTLATSKLRPANAVDFDVNIHLAAGDSDTADQVVIYNHATKFFDTYYFNNATNPAPFGNAYHPGWVSTSDLETDASNTILPAGRGFFILRRVGRPAFNWDFDKVTP